MTIAARLIEAGKEYKTGESTIVALQPTTIEFRTGEITLLVGPSGSGKTTLLSLLGSVIYPSTGKVWVGDTCVNDLSEKELADLRLQHIGFVFQGFNLLAPLNALENVMEPLLLQGEKRKEAKRKAMELIRKFGMEDRIYNLPRNLSGGQQQRIAIARSLVTNPQLILCDEPTASLDHKSAKMVMDMLTQLSLDDRAVIVVTHDVRLKKYADRTIYVSEGRISETAMEDDF
ncbi:MAG: ABC transporter ATP-binding protein [Proteiniphilum sp.]|jgi:putative ABC transport system ATP-binding protein|nr:ABC transporter ATP-binding protein [Proteiniphilum sp.]NCB24713.1 ABC transporter ATP-binding protein [Bacteroidia bacterium]MDD2937169.1 ABC transporter ATP-binding protein [Proteiniphilum sp.]MDD3076764.1 ABC transporter ATP-binding protein [Proteiniphilum sp.]MDD3778697.1 ABC transporter ATP-binding protein [Proteiniphilum sp.]